ncbi:MAG: SRPBCC family protein [Burkholderiaceae bacterium]
MATIYKEFKINATPDFVWAAIKDVGAIHTRLAQGFVTNTVLVDDMRTVTFTNGFVVKERIITVSDEHRRLAYTAVEGRASHHNASLQVFDELNGQSRVLWITDLLPDEMHGPIEQMVELGSQAITKTLESTFALTK